MYYCLLKIKKINFNIQFITPCTTEMILEKKISENSYNQSRSSDKDEQLSLVDFQPLLDSTLFHLYFPLLPRCKECCSKFLLSLLVKYS